MYMRGKYMRTLSEVNRDIENCQTLINSAKDRKSYLHYKAILYNLKDEKELIWNSLFDGHKNMMIL